MTIGDPGDGGGTGLLDVDGRYYAMILGGTPTARIVLLQTDALPDQGEICMDAPLVPFCNAYHGNWMHLYQPTPPAE